MNSLLYILSKPTKTLKFHLKLKQLRAKFIHSEYIPQQFHILSHNKHNTPPYDQNQKGVFQKSLSHTWNEMKLISWYKMIKS